MFLAETMPMSRYFTAFNRAIAFRVVELHMFRASHYFKVFDTIVGFISIYMMNDLVNSEFSAYRLFYESPMNRHKNSIEALNKISAREGILGWFLEFSVRVSVFAKTSIMHNAKIFRIMGSTATINGARLCARQKGDRRVTVTMHTIIMHATQRLTEGWFFTPFDRARF